MSIQRIGDMPDDVGNYIQNFLRPDLIKEKQKKLLKIFHKQLKRIEYCDYENVYNCPCPDVIERLDDYKDSEIFFTTCNYKVKWLGFKDFHKSFMMWFRTASGEFSETFPLSEYYVEMNHDIDRLYTLLGYANEYFNITDLSLTESDLILNKVNYIKWKNNYNIH